MVYFIQVFFTACEQDQDGVPSGNLYDIYHCCVYSEKLQMMDRGSGSGSGRSQFRPDPARKLYDIYPFFYHTKY